MKKILIFCGLLLLAVPLMAQINMGGRLLMGALYSPEPIISDEDNAWQYHLLLNFSKAVGDYVSFYAEFQNSNAHPLLFGLDPYVYSKDPLDYLMPSAANVTVDLAGAFLNATGSDAQLPVGISLKAGKYGTFERLNTSVVPGAMDSAQFWLSGYHNAWLVSLSLSIPNIITVDIHYNPILGYGGKIGTTEFPTSDDRPYIFIDAYGGTDISGMRLEYEVAFCNESMPFGMAEEELALAASIGTGSMLGELQVKAGGSVALNLSKENPANPEWHYGAGLGLSYTKMLNLGIGLNGGDDGYGGVATGCTMHTLGVIATSTPIDLVTIGAGAYFAMYEDAPSSIDRVDVQLKLNLPVTIAVGYLYRPEDAAANAASPEGNQEWLWSPLCHVTDSAQTGSGVYFAIECWF